MARAQPMFYFVQNEDAQAHPNAFFVPASGNRPTLADFLAHFPLSEAEFHFRFQAADENGSYIWADAPLDVDAELPDYRGRILCKALRLRTPSQPSPPRARPPPKKTKPAPKPAKQPSAQPPAPQPSPSPNSTKPQRPSAPSPMDDPFGPNFGSAPTVVQPGAVCVYNPGGNQGPAKGSKLDDAIQARMNEWSTKKGAQAGGTGLRNLLCTVHEVLWPEAKWEPKSLSQLIQTNAVKTAYRKVMLIVHPDRNGKAPPEQQLVAERIFNVLTVAWDEFCVAEGCR